MDAGKKSWRFSGLHVYLTLQESVVQIPQKIYAHLYLIKTIHKIERSFLGAWSMVEAKLITNIAHKNERSFFVKSCL